MPAIEITKPAERHSLSDNLLIHDHGLANVSAAYLLVFGRRAIHAYANDKGADLSLLVPLLTDTVGAWIDANGGSRAEVSAVAEKLEDRMLPVDYLAPAEAPQRPHVKRLMLH